jgi:hypothetical protein
LSSRDEMQLEESAESPRLHRLISGAAAAHHDLSSGGGCEVPPDIMREQAKSTAAARWKAAEGLRYKAEWGSRAEGSASGWPEAMTACMLSRA